ESPPGAGAVVQPAGTLPAGAPQPYGDHCKLRADHRAPRTPVRPGAGGDPSAASLSARLLIVRSAAATRRPSRADGTGPTEAGGAAQCQRQRKIRSATAKQLTVHAPRMASSVPTPVSGTPCSMLLRSASIRADRGRIAMKGCIASGKRSAEKKTPESTH